MGEGSVGKKANIWFQDRDTVKRRVGVIVEEGVGFLTIKNEFGTEMLPNCNIVRIEVLD